MRLKFEANTVIGDRDMAETKIVDGGRRHLKFPNNSILGPSSPPMGNMKQYTKFGANRS